MKRWVVSAILFAFWIPSPLFAFGVPQHTAIAAAAFDIYERCRRAPIGQSASLRQAFMRGSVEEDTMNLMERALNWHFYNRDGATRNGWFFNRSHDVVFKRRIGDLERLLTEKPTRAARFHAAGAVAHHIQDMSSPAHVMPIYHANGIFGVKDAFDAFPLTSFAPILPSCPTVQCPAPDADAFMSSLRNDAALHTIDEIGKPVVFDDGRSFPDERWLLFWSDDKEGNHGFRKYGLYGNRFGKTFPCRTNSCECKPDTYADFYRERFRRAVEDSVKVLLYLDCRMR